jgi:uncharacterized protein (TIGR03435 family)
MRAIIAVALVVVAHAKPQPAARPEFEVVSVKPGDPASKGSSWGAPPGRVTARNITLKGLILTAYHLNEYQLESGPQWMDSARFDIDAKLPPGAPSTQVPLMLQAMLADRFKLDFHRETKTLREYALVVAKGGPKLQEAAASDPKGQLSQSFTHAARKIEGRGVAMSGLVNVLMNPVGAPILDQTGLKGLYNFTLEFAPQLETFADDEPEPLPTIFSAVQIQLGLKLEETKGPVEVLVIRRAEKPTAN